ncbi:MAG: hypothetical protein HY904_22185 [Deltaproteobacteria bacterium]|nr:hypothetical protein [Deltaproteobacteria bacterium]
MATSKGMDIKHLDRRVVARYVRKGVISDKDYKAYLKDLPDLEGQYDSLALPEPSSEDDTDDEAAAS